MSTMRPTRDPPSIDGNAIQYADNLTASPLSLDHDTEDNAGLEPGQNAEKDENVTMSVVNE